MNEEIIPASLVCPNCGGIVTTDARFCQHCAFDLAAAPLPAPPTEPPARAPEGRKYLPLAVGGALMLAAVALFVYFKSRHTAPSAATPSQVMTERARQVEARILQGATVTNAEIAGLSAYELRVLRNVHFARYGRVYDRPGLGDYFYTRSWYKPSSDYNDKLLTATDKANINVLLAEENRVKAAEAAQAAAATPAASESAPPSTNSGGGLAGLFSTSALTTDKVQRAVDAMLNWTRKDGGTRVLGVQEVPQQNLAKADLRFENFRYVADDFGSPVSKTKTTPPNPDINSPNYWEELNRSVTQRVRETRYSGDGVAILKHYNDGRWVLTEIHFGMTGVNGNITIQ